MRRTVVISMAVVVLVAAAATMWWLSREIRPRPAAFRGEPTSALYAPIDTRVRDARPLTLNELFSAATLDGFTRRETAEFTDCAEALDGVTASGCTQALRAVYGDASAAGQFVVFNLPDGRAADELVAALAHGGFLRQAVSFDVTRSRAQARALGHFVTVSWVGPVDDDPDLGRAHVVLDGLAKGLQPRVLAAAS